MANMLVPITDIFIVNSGDIHAANQLDGGGVPLISCGQGDNGLVGFFDIDEDLIYQNAITVAYNGIPFTTKYHPYQFAAKDDVAVLQPRRALRVPTLLYIVAVLNSKIWRYSYGRKCFKNKMKKSYLLLPGEYVDGRFVIDEDYIESLWSKSLADYTPAPRRNDGGYTIQQWKEFGITELFNVRTGDFHSISELDAGETPVVSRVTTDNGICGYYSPPDEAEVYPKGTITVSTVGGDAFVQCFPFIVTDNVILCIPRIEMSIHTLYFVAYMLNHQKWRYSYGRQCYQTKFEQVRINLPVRDGNLDEVTMRGFVTDTSFWHVVERRLVPDA